MTEPTKRTLEERFNILDTAWNLACRDIDELGRNRKFILVLFVLTWGVMFFLHWW